MKAISDLETVLASAKDILEWRLEAKNDQIRSMHFVDLTIGDAIPLNDFIDRQNTTADSTALGIDLKSREMEVAASDLVRLLTSGYDEEVAIFPFAYTMWRFIQPLWGDGKGEKDMRILDDVAMWVRERSLLATTSTKVEGSLPRLFPFPSTKHGFSSSKIFYFFCCCKVE